MIKLQAKKHKDGSYSIGQLDKNGKLNGLGMYFNPKTGKYIVGEIKGVKPIGWHIINQLDNSEINIKIDNAKHTKAKKWSVAYFGLDEGITIQMFNRNKKIKGKCNYEVTINDDRWDIFNIETHKHAGYLVNPSDRRLFKPCDWARDKVKAYLDPKKDTLFDPIVGGFTIPQFDKDYKFKEIDDSCIMAENDGPLIIHDEKAQFTTFGFAKNGKYNGVVFVYSKDYINVIEFNNGVRDGLFVTVNKNTYQTFIMKLDDGKLLPITMYTDPDMPSFGIMNYKYRDKATFDLLLNNLSTFATTHYIKVDQSMNLTKIKSKDIFDGK